jgi:Cu(I)/Ag(I) efflux system membrane fusion protein
MDMELVPRYADEAEVTTDAGPALTVPVRAQQALGLRLAAVERRVVAAAAEVTGTVQLNERDVSIVQARTAGFVERVHALAPGDVVAAGTPLAEVLNPEWLGAQQEYLAVMQATHDAVLTQAARQRLVLLGMSAGVIERVERSRQPVLLQTLTAPAGGVITELAVRNGMSVAPGMTLARINGLDPVWLEAALPEAQAALLQPGQPVQARLPALPAARRVARRPARRISRLVERPRPRARRSGRVAGHHRPGARQARRQPHRASVHWRLCWRSSLRHVEEARTGTRRV